MGWLAWSCIAILVLLLASVLLTCWMGYEAASDIASMTAVEPAAIPAMDGGVAVERDLVARIGAFQQAAAAGNFARLELNANELNTLIERDPVYQQSQGRVFVSLEGDLAVVQCSLPVSLPRRLAPFTFFQGRYLNAEFKATARFDGISKNFDWVFSRLFLNGVRVTPEQHTPFEPEMNSALNLQLRKSSQAMEVLNNADSIRILDGKLIVLHQAADSPRTAR